MAWEAKCRKGREEYRLLKGIKEEMSLQQFRENARFLSENPDYKAWIRIAGTIIDYPVVQRDNQYYLDHSFYGLPLGAGCLFIDEAIRPFQEENTVIYGHNRKDGSMFAELKKYREVEYYREHSVIEVDYGLDTLKYEIFSCYTADSKKALQAYRYLFGTDGEKDAFLERAKKSSLYDTGVIPECKDQILTLSTCYGPSQRMIVQARLV